MQDKFEIRIPSGRLKGRKITLLSSDKTRSTKALVADSFFDTLRQSVRGCEFVELFGGSALMAIRAISEGAKCAYAFEKDKQSFGILKENIKKLGLENELFAQLGDTFALAANTLENKESSMLILYADPPFSIREGYDDIYEKCVDLVSRIPAKIVVFEHLSTIKLPQSIANFTLLKSKKFGKTTLSYFFANS